ncbi:class I SAM-dependent methyltransferase [uncultured Mailhella sp.]|uniref:class I SAM-dependent methyltransferase n=1 Tax=uncultured Mailhella sp. TaxID=1981031 RepID=UPI002624B2D1|nr:class I SAM-dependent methyltransferase [uncultured Mailhella sp.]
MSDKKVVFSNYFFRDRLMGFARGIMLKIYSRFPILSPNSRLCAAFRGKKISVLDAGCGEGEQMYITRTILPDAEITGVDVSCSLIYKDIGTFVACDLSKDKLPFTDESFDYVYSQHVIEHLEDPLHFIKECKRVLKPGGVLYIECPDVRWTLLPHIPFICGREGGFNFWDDPTHLRPWSRNALRKIAKMGGFRDEGIKTFYVRKWAHLLSFPLMFLSRNDDYKVAFLHSLLGLWCGMKARKLPLIRQ